MRELGETILSKARYAQRKIAGLGGVEAPIFKSQHFKEFTVRFQSRTLKEVDKTLHAHHIQAGIHLKGQFPRIGETSLMCVTEVHSKRHIDALVSALKEAVE
jgi:glycine dehydrogenase subunit 1